MGHRGVAWPGDMAAESGPTTWRLGPVGGAQRSDVASMSVSRVVARWWLCLAVGQASPVSKGPGNSTLVGEKKEKRKRKRRKNSSVSQEDAMACVPASVVFKRGGGEDRRGEERRVRDDAECRVRIRTCVATHATI